MANNKDSKKPVLNFLKSIEGFGFRVWKSIFSHRWYDSTRTRLLAIISNVFLQLHPTTIRRASLKMTYTFCLGGLSFFFFLMLTVSGILLMFYYIPSVTQAYQNMKDIETVVFAGQLLRNMHSWSAFAMVITVLLHMCRVVYSRAYRPPREFNWIVGLLLLFVTLLLSLAAIFYRGINWIFGQLRSVQISQKLPHFLVLILNLCSSAVMKSGRAP